MTASIYFLHTGDFVPRYAGRTTVPVGRRLAEHRRGSPEHGGQRHKVVDKTLELFVVRDGIEGMGVPEEKEYIALLRSAGYVLWNKNHGSGGPGHPSDESRAKMSLASTGRTLTEEAKAKISASRMGVGVPHTEATKAKMSVTRTGMPVRPMTEELQLKISNGLKIYHERRRHEIASGILET